MNSIHNSVCHRVLADFQLANMFPFQKKAVNSAVIVHPDRLVGNGVVHVIDKVLLPPQFNAIEIIKQDPRLS